MAVRAWMPVRTGDQRGRNRVAALKIVAARHVADGRQRNMAGSVAPGRRAGERQSALAAVRIAGRKRPRSGARDGRSVTAGRGGTACSDRCVAVADTSRSSSLRRMRANTPSCGSKNSPKSSPPNRHAPVPTSRRRHRHPGCNRRHRRWSSGDHRVGARRTRPESTRPDPDRDDAALIRHRFGEHGPQLRALNRTVMSVISGGRKTASRREGGKLL